MRFLPSLLDEIRARLPVSQVVARRVTLKRAGRELKGLSPFKQEKTPSFFVNDHKGSWFDFASGQNGDIFKFVMLSEGLSFPEAVERLAEQAGIPLPKVSLQETQREDERSRLYGLMEASCRFFETQLAAAVGQEARRYLERLEELTGVPFCLISTGAVRDDTIVCESSPLLSWYPGVRGSLA